MKKLLFTLLVGITSLAYSQAPQQISYQGVARNASGTVLANQPIGIKFDIHQGSASGPVVFTETHTGVSTNGFGLFTTYIGSISNLAVISWSTNSYFIEVSVDPNTGTYSSLGSQQLMSVPYALNAGSAPAPAVSFTNNILSVGGNTTSITSGTTYTAGTGISISGGVISNTLAPITPTITSGNNITINPTSPSNSYTVSAPSYSLSQSGNNIDLLQNGTSISSVTLSAANPTTTVINGNNITLNQSGSTYTVNAPTYSLSQSGNNIDLLQNGTSIGTATLPVVTSYSAGNGIDITGGVISNTLIPTTQTLSISGNSISINPGNTQALPNYSLTQSGANIDLTQNGASIATVTLTAATSTSLSAGSSNILLNQSGNAYTITPITPTFTNIGPTTITGSFPNYTVNSVASPSTTLVQGNNVTLNQSGSTYTVNAAPYSLSSNSNTLTLTNGTVVSTATVPVQSSYVGTANNITVTSNTINLATTGVTAGTYGINANNSVPTFSVDNFGRLTTASQYTPNVAGDVIGSINTSTVSKLRGVNISTVAPTANQLLQFNAGSWTPTTIAPAVITGTGTGIATVTTASTNFTVNVPPPVYTQTTGVLGFGTSTISITPTLSLTGTTLTSGPSTNSVNLATLPGLWTAPTATSVVTTNSISLVGIGTNTPSYKLDVYANGSVPATIHGYNSGATASSTGVFGENPNNGIGVFGQSNSGKGVWGSSTSDAGLYGESVSGDGGKFILSSNTTTANAVNAQTNGSGAALYAKSYNATPLAAKFDGNTIINHTSTSALPHVTLVSPTISDFGRFKFFNTGSVNYFALEGRNNTGGVNDAFDISHYNGVNEKQIFLINGTRNVFINNLNIPLTTFHVMTSTATASGGIASEGFGQSGQLNLTRNNNAGAGGRTSVFGGDELGKLNFAGYDGSTFGDGAKIYAKATENVTGATKGTELVFAAVPSGSSVNSDVFKINGSNKLEVITGLLIPTAAAPGKILTSDALGNASWQTITAPASPWIQGIGIVTQGTFNDKVGIGTNTPSSLLHIVSSVPSPSQLILGNVNQPSTEWEWRVDALSNLSLINEGSGSPFTSMFTENTTGNIGIGTTSPSSKLNAVSSGTTTSAGRFDITNSSNSSVGLLSTSNGSGMAIEGLNTGTGMAGYFFVQNASSSATGVQVTTTGTGNALNANANTGSAINAVSAGAVATELIFNNGSGDGLQIFTGSGRGINATNTSNIVAAAQFYNDGTSNSLLATKNSTTTGGNVARIENNSSSNAADAVFVLNNGAGAAIHANSATTSTVGLWLENGHLKATGTTVTTGSLNVVGGFTVPSFAPILTNCNDVKGTFSFTTSVTGIVAGAYIELEIKFSKPYVTVPTVIATPLTDLQGLSYMVTNTTAASFFVRVYRTANTNVTLPTTIVSGSMFKFNYMVIE